jgi:hypothetical protein
MHEQLVGYLLGALDPAEQAEIERHLSQRQDLQRDFEKLRCCLDPLHADRGHFDPPAALAARTCSRVQQERAVRTAQVLPAGGGRRWGVLDLAVAAGIIITATLLFFPAVNRSRGLARSAICQDHLRQISSGLHQYSQLYNGYLPHVPTEGSLALGGIYAPLLHSAGFVPDERTFLCPSCGLSDDPNFHMPTPKELATLNGPQLEQARKYAGGSYGYTLGHFEDGHYAGTHDRLRSNFALMSDSPCPENPDRQTRNHDGRGQNVLFEDGHVAYLNAPLAEGSHDHLFLNEEGDVAPGIHPNDSVIVPGSFIPKPLSSRDN